MNRIYIVCPTKDVRASGVFNFAFDSALDAAEKFAADVTRSTWEAWCNVSSPSGFSGCEGLSMYLHTSTNSNFTEFEVSSVFVQGNKYSPNHFDGHGKVLDQNKYLIYERDGKRVVGQHDVVMQDLGAVAYPGDRILRLFHVEPTCNTSEDFFTVLWQDDRGMYLTDGPGHRVDVVLVDELPEDDE